VAPGAAAPPAAPAQAPARLREDTAVAAERVRRENIILQLERQFHVSVDATASTDELDRELRRCVAGDRPRTRAAVDAEPPAADAAATETGALVEATGPVAPAAAVALVPAALDLKAFAKPAGMVSGLVVDYDGDRLVGVTFNASLAEQLPAIMGYAAGSMTKAKQARTCLILLGHGDGTSIGMGEHPVNLTDHLRANRQAYHAALGTAKIDCVAILSCSRQADAQFTAFRDGLGYYPTWRVSSWERTYQNAISGLLALQLALMQGRETRFRAAVFYDEQQQVASLSEVGERTGTVFYAIAQTATGYALVPTRRR
jgi:hypothetical protein